MVFILRWEQSEFVTISTALTALKKDCYYNMWTQGWFLYLKLELLVLTVLLRVCICPFVWLSHFTNFFLVITDGVSPNNTSLKSACPVHGHTHTHSEVCERVSSQAAGPHTSWDTVTLNCPCVGKGFVDEWQPAFLEHIFEICECPTLESMKYNETHVGNSQFSRSHIKKEKWHGWNKFSYILFNQVCPKFYCLNMRLV